MHLCKYNFFLLLRQYGRKKKHFKTFKAWLEVLENQLRPFEWLAESSWKSLWITARASINIYWSYSPQQDTILVVNIPRYSLYHLSQFYKLHSIILSLSPSLLKTVIKYENSMAKTRKQTQQICHTLLNYLGILS